VLVSESFSVDDDRIEEVYIRTLTPEEHPSGAYSSHTERARERILSGAYTSTLSAPSENAQFHTPPGVSHGDPCISTQTLKANFAKDRHFKAVVGGKVYFFLAMPFTVLILNLDTQEWEKRRNRHPLFTLGSRIHFVWVLDGLIYIVLEHDTPRQHPEMEEGDTFQWSTWVYDPEADIGEEAEAQRKREAADSRGYPSIPGLLTEIDYGGWTPWEEYGRRHRAMRVNWPYDSLEFGRERERRKDREYFPHPVVVGSRAYFYTGTGMISFGLSDMPDYQDPTYRFYGYHACTLHAVGHYVLMMPAYMTKQTRRGRYLSMGQALAYDTISAEYVVWGEGQKYGLDFFMPFGFAVLGSTDYIGSSLLFEPEMQLVLPNKRSKSEVKLEVDPSLVYAHGGTRLVAPPTEFHYLRLHPDYQ
ncbi:hypothetical protein KIPB_007974, partial [Kipferlia bialata]